MEQRVKAKQYYHSKDQHGKLYVQTKDLFGEFTSRKCLKECHHKYDTQMRDLIPPLQWLHPNIKHMVWGEKKFLSAVFKKLDMEVTDGLTIFLEQKDKTW
eukprot:8872772-Ditylum_brightwellii.AAC.1